VRSRLVIFGLLVTVFVLLGAGLVWWLGKGSGPEKDGEEKVAGGNLVVVSWGGRYQEAQNELFFQPFSEVTGIKVTQDRYSGDYGLIRRQIRENDVVWDLVQVEHLFLAAGSRENLLEEISIPNNPDYREESKSTHGLASIAWSYVLAYRPGSEDEPETWADFWDLKKYPGRRSLWSEPQMNLEIALLADGVEPENLYPIDVERALRKLDKIRKSIYWWGSGDDLEQKIMSGDFAMIGAWSGRVVSAWINNRETPPMKFVYDGAILSHDFWVIPKGAKNKAEAQSFLEYHSNAVEAQIDFFVRMGYGPPNQRALPAIADEPKMDYLRELLPNGDNWGLQIPFDASWWASEYEWVNDRWREWKKQR